MRSHYGGHNKDMVNTLILIDIMISATICHPLPTTHDLPPSAWRLQLCTSLNQIPRSTYGSIQSGEIRSVLPLESELGSKEPSRLGVYHDWEHT